jgi:hypothetical protein
MSARSLATGSEEIGKSATLGSFRIWAARRPRERSLHAYASDARLDEYGFQCSRVLCWARKESERLLFIIVAPDHHVEMRDGDGRIRVVF